MPRRPSLAWRDAGATPASHRHFDLCGVPAALSALRRCQPSGARRVKCMIADLPWDMLLAVERMPEDWRETELEWFLVRRAEMFGAHPPPRRPIAAQGFRDRD
jgi:hypothetical protein